MRNFLIHWLVIAIALGVTAKVLPGVTIDSWMTLAVASLVLGLVNAIVRPVMQFLSLPATILTFGIFYFVVNGIAFALAAWLVPGFGVRSLLWAILAALVVGLLSSVIASLTGGGERRSESRA
jgi:putative membrane protein